MPTFVTTSPLQLHQAVELSNDDLYHLTHVLRIKPGEIFHVTDNQGTVGEVKVTSIKPMITSLINIFSGEKPFLLTVCLPLIEQDRLEWAIEKLCELNVATIQLVTTARTQNHLLSPNKWQRLQKIATSSQKQCGRSFPLKLKETLKLVHIKIPEGGVGVVASLEAPLWSVDSFKGTSDQEHFLFVGPEGGFTAEEEKSFEEKGFLKISLGKTTLRAETGAIVLASLIKHSLF